MRIFILIVCICVTSLIFAQKLEVQKTHTLSKDAVRGELFYFDYNQSTQTYLLGFKREGKKASVLCEFYQFDKDFELLSNETTQLKDSKTKYTEAFDPGYNPDTEVAWKNPKMLKVVPNMTGQIMLKKGYMTREWKTGWDDKGNYRYYYAYWKYDFQEEEEIKPKFEGIISIPEGAPAMVQKMAENAGKKMVYVGHITEEPQFNVTTGRRSIVYPSFSERKADYSDAIGNVLVVGRSDQMSYDEGNMTKRPIYTTYVGLKYKAEDLSLLNSATAFCGFNALDLYKTALSDGSYVVIAAPSKFTQNEEIRPNDYAFIRFSKDGDVIDNISFESKGGPWKIYGASLGSDNDVYVWGGTSIKKKDKFHPMSSGVVIKSEDYIQVMKIKDNQVAYLTSLPLKDVNAKVVQPAGQKKAVAWSGENFNLWANPIITANGSLIIPGNPVDKSAFHYFQFSPKGDLEAQYVMNFDQKSVDGADIIHIFYQIPDTEKYTCMIMEIEKLENGKEFRYPKVATLDLKNKSMTSFINIGYGKEKYYLDPGYPMVYLDGGKKITFFSFDAKGKSIFLGRVNLADQSPL